MSEADEILAKLLAGDADAGEIARLKRQAEHDAGLRSRLAALAGIDGMLGVALEDEVTRERRHLQVMEAVKASEREAFVGAVRSRVTHTRWKLRSLAAAAVLAFAFTGWWLVAARSGTVATVARVETATWQDGAARGEGSRFKAGGRLRLASGLVELDVGGKGRMVVEGPADLEFTAADRAVLRRGRVVMRVTPAGHGYRMETPEGAVVDLGTEFGVSVAENGEVETHVLDGEVEAYPNGGGKVLLKRDDALRFANGGERIPADGGAFYTALPPVRQETAHFVRWAMDENQGSTATSVERGLAPGPKDLVLHSMDAGGLPQWTPGVFGSALSFDGKGAYAESAFRGIGGGQSRTVCFWVKVPEDFSQREGFAILSWGRFATGRPGEVWQIAVNPIEADGPVGRIRVGTHEGQVVGTADLRDGKWHHVAIVLYGGSRPDVGTHVMVYLDGRLEPISRRALREIRTEIDAANHGVWLGRNITYTRPAPGHSHGGFFRGAVDEACIFDAALSQAEIRRLIDTNGF